MKKLLIIATVLIAGVAGVVAEEEWVVAQEGGEWVSAGSAGDENVRLRVTEEVVEQPRGYLGATIAQLETAVSGVQSLILEQVFEGSAAQKAGLRSGDQLLEIDGIEMASYSDLTEKLADTRPGDRVRIVVRRGESDEPYYVELGEHPDHHAVRWAVVVDEDRPYLGVEFEWLNPQLAEFMGVEHGILVKRVVEGAPAFQAGLAAGDVIVAIDGQPLTGGNHLHDRIAAGEPGEGIRLDVNRRGAAHRIDATLGSAKDFMESEGLHNHFVFGESEIKLRHVERIQPEVKILLEQKKNEEKE
ncbi:hypothetical protein ABI59_10910 [Acidobacteria bacterium Mor1]|nr:hypothetical protein ABI59_10910 [Acidobacteria bacterium Mor1]